MFKSNYQPKGVRQAFNMHVLMTLIIRGTRSKFRITKHGQHGQPADCMPTADSIQIYVFIYFR